MFVLRALVVRDHFLGKKMIGPPITSFYIYSWRINQRHMSIVVYYENYKKMLSQSSTTSKCFSHKLPIYTSNQRPLRK